LTRYGFSRLFSTPQQNITNMLRTIKKVKYPKDYIEAREYLSAVGRAFIELQEHKKSVYANFKVRSPLP